jgi:hypothetical protein
MKRLVLRSFQSPGDVAMLTAAVRGEEKGSWTEWHCRL